MPLATTSVFIAIGVGFLTSLFNFSLILATSYLLNNFNYICDNRPFITLISLLFLTATVMVWNYINKQIIYMLNRSFVTAKMTSSWGHMMSLPITFIKKYTPSELTNIITHYEEAILEIPSSISTLFSHSLLFIMIIFYLIYCNFLIGLSSCILFCSLITFKSLLFPYRKQLIFTQSEYQYKYLYFLQEALAQIKKIRTGHFERFVYNKWQNLYLSANNTNKKILLLDLINYLLEASCPIIIFILLCLYLYFNYPSANEFSALTFLVCLIQLTHQYEQLSKELFSLLNTLALLKRASPLLHEPLDTSPPHSITSFKGQITLRSISFNRLNNVSLQIMPGSFVALIGPSGSGKSTILRLLLGLETSYSGEIFFDGINSKHLDHHAIRKQFGVVLQNSSLIPGTIFSNIAANSQITLTEAWELAAHVGLTNDINTMPMKMFTYISDTADNSISGGQRQKIFIARALACKPKILILDEATSALDNISQADIFNHLSSLNITRLVIAHRHSTIKDADNIYYLNEGQVVDSGAFIELTQRQRIATHL